MAETENDSRPLFPALGLRLGLWYATLFIVSSIAIVFVTYWLTSASLAQRDRQIVQQKLVEYADAYRRGGLGLLADTVRAEPERLFVRVVDRGAEALVLNQPERRDPSTLDTASLRLADGTLVQVGKSTQARQDLLARFRAALGIVTLSIVAIALAGGFIVTQSALAPIRRLTQAAGRIIRTGRTDERVPLPPNQRTTDAIDELTVLFNTMLDKIEGLVTAMRGALDNVSHDLRTPLTRMRGTAEMALASPPDMDQYREALADCVEESDRVLVMLNALMDISEAESGAMQLHRREMHLAEVAGRAVELYRDLADAKGITLSLQVSSDVVVTADETRLQQVAANLIDNALKYTPAAGRVDVEVRRDAGRAVLQVRDTGVGIVPEELPRIWDRLFRGDRSRTERGLGLGLSLVKAIVQAHGGTVEVASEPGKGSAFSVFLPS